VTASAFVIRALEEAGITAAFGLPGVHALGLWNALSESGIRYVGFRHEQAAAHAADGYGRATGMPGVVLLSTGPGALNALSALAEAYVSSSPVLAISSAIPSSLVGRGKGFLHEGKDLAPAFSAVTAFHGRAASVDEIPGLLKDALGATTHGRPRPALIEIPVDLLDQDLDANPALSAQRPPDMRLAEGIDEAASLLSLAARPVIWAGGGVLTAKASAELREVAELLQAPVVTTFMGKGSLPENHLLAIGALVRQPETVALLADADAMLALGTRFSSMATNRWQLQLPQQLIHVDVDPEELGRNYPVRLGIEADARMALAALRDALKTRIDAPRESRAAQAASVRGAAFERARREGPREMAFLEAVRSALDPEITTVHDMTIPSYWSWPFFEVTEPGTFHSPYGYASLGFSFPAAIGIAAADPSRPVVAFSGDGGFQYHERELSTVAQYDLPVVTIVFNDRAWGVLQSFAESRYGKTFGLKLPGPDFVALALAHGVPADRTEDPDELEKMLRRAIESRGPHLIEVPSTWGLPPPSDYYKR
jgi:acetolactate synthase-1/2/3 large subunit